MTPLERWRSSGTGRRMVLMLVAVGLLLAGLAFVKYRQVQAAMAQGAFTPPPEAVTTVVARLEPWPEMLQAVGTAEAVRGVTVSADLPGIVHRITFESGRKVGAGELLVELDARQETAQLAAAEAQRELTRLNLKRARGLRDEGITSEADFDRSSAEAKQAEARVGEIRATIERKTIRAPFAGVLGIRRANLGQYLNGGDPIVSLQAVDPIYVNFSVPQRVAGRLRAGGEVRVTADGLQGASLGGRITAVDSVVDEATRNVKVQATFENVAARLQPGMFVDAQVVLGAADQSVAIPATAVSYAPYGDSVFIVEDLKGPDGKPYRGVRQQFVKLGPARGDQVAVLQGVEAGDEVVTSGVFKLRNGAAVLVNNEKQPPNEPAPRPEDS